MNQEVQQESGAQEATQSFDSAPDPQFLDSPSLESSQPLSSQALDQDPGNTANESPVKTEDESLSVEEIVKQASFNETPEAKLANVEARYAESSKEAKTLKSQIDQVNDLLSKQGLKLSFDDNGVALDSDGETPGKTKLNFSDLSEDQQDLFDTDPEAAFNAAVKLASQKLVTPNPSRAEKPPSYNENTVLDTLGKLEAAKDLPMELQGLDKVMPVIKGLIKDGLTPEVKDILSRHPLEGLKLIKARVDAVQRGLSATQKPESPATPVNTGGGGSGQRASSGGASSGDMSHDLGKLIAGAS